MWKNNDDDKKETGINLENLIKINRKNSRNRLIIALFSLEEVIINRKINNNNKVFKGGLIVSLWVRIRKSLPILEILEISSRISKDLEILGILESLEAKIKINNHRINKIIILIFSSRNNLNSNNNSSRIICWIWMILEIVISSKIRIRINNKRRKMMILTCYSIIIMLVQIILTTTTIIIIMDNSNREINSSNNSSRNSLLT